MKDSYYKYNIKEREKFIFRDENLKKMQDYAHLIALDLSFLCRSEGALKEFEERLDFEKREMEREENE